MMNTTNNAIIDNDTINAIIDAIDAIDAHDIIIIDVATSIAYNDAHDVNNDVIDVCDMFASCM